jgi:hypothetical protein
MNDSQALLRMLEPTVRPVPGDRPATRPASAQSGGEAEFTQWLEAARQQAQTETAEQAPTPNESTDASAMADQSVSQPTLTNLGGIDRIENPTLRQLMTQRQSMDDAEQPSSSKQ